MSRSQPEPQQQKQLQDSQQRQHASGDCLRLRHIAQTDLGKFSQGEHMRVHPRKHHHSRRRTLPLHGAHDKSFQSISKCDDDTCKDLHDSVMLFNGTDALQGIGESMMKNPNVVWSRILLQQR